MANYHSFSPNTVEANQIDYYDTIELVSGDKKTGWIYINREQK